MRESRRISKKKKGFTLIELIIVIAILGILAFIVVPNFKGHKDDAKDSADQTNGKIIADAAAMAITKDTIEFKDKKYVGTKGENIQYTPEEKNGPGPKVAEATEITEQLDSVPKANTSDGDFYIKIDENGKIIVSVNEKKGSLEYKQVYPKQETNP
ncbi:type II secretion system protein [Clostridium brassicae]|uniref:Type II secretion system protein n=1 Tax=Clostridium brassicae TaxID=2999072 RepID=A0ABT4DDL3_9CLOT|nr:type II secretion system protein [Clostridium brassicae]MCY6959301.1 type II secretion system protein [Clostridium brassicae]